MNLLVRSLWVLIVSCFKPRISPLEEISLPLRILPNDLDLNGHLNNGRYLLLLDLASLALFLRSGMVKQMVRLKLRPMVGGTIISYRKGLSLFERCTLAIRWVAWDDRWHYFRFIFLNANGTLSATGYFKGALVSKNGIYPTDEIFRQFGFNLKERKIPPAVAYWMASEKALFSRQDNPSFG